MLRLEGPDPAREEAVFKGGSGCDQGHTTLPRAGVISGILEVLRGPKRVLLCPQSSEAAEEEWRQVAGVVAHRLARSTRGSTFLNLSSVYVLTHGTHCPHSEPLSLSPCMHIGGADTCAHVEGGGVSGELRRTEGPLFVYFHYPTCLRDPTKPG